MATKTDPAALRKAPITTPSDIHKQAVQGSSGALNALLADVFALYLKTKNFGWHMTGPHFRDYHLLLDEHGDQVATASLVENGMDQTQRRIWFPFEATRTC
jgi:starvation-inducible DNA-binding protein